MKRILPAALALMVLFAAGAHAQSNQLNRTKKGKKGGAAATANTPNSNEIHWMTLDEVQVAMKAQPRKVWVDVYTSWCGWCKVMDKKTFTNPQVINYVNEHFYMVKLDAEQKADIMFMGKAYHHNETSNTNDFAVELMQGKMSYPTGVFMEENFLTPQLVPGYQDVPAFEMIIKYLGEGVYKTTPFDQYQKEFKPTWTAL